MQDAGVLDAGQVYDPGSPTKLMQEYCGDAALALSGNLAILLVQSALRPSLSSSCGFQA